MLPESIAARLKALREARGITKYRLAKDTGVSETYIYRIEKGLIENPRRDTLQKLAAGLNIAIAQLIGDTSPVDQWQLVEQSLKAYIPVYSGVFEVDMVPIDHVVCTREVVPPESVRGYRAESLCFSPLIEPNDTIIVDTALVPKAGDIVVVIKDGEASLKRYLQEDNETWLVDHHCRWQLDGATIHGVITDLVRKLR